MTSWRGDNSSPAELLWGGPDLGCGWLIPLLAVSEGVSALAAWHAYGLVLLVGVAFSCSLFCMLGRASCPPEHHVDGLCCPFDTIEGARRWDYAPCWVEDITSTCGPNLLQQMGFQLSLQEPPGLHH